MAIQIPPKPPPFTEKPGADNPNYHTNLQAHQEKMFEWQMAVQNAQAEMKQSFELASNTRKAADDAMENMIRNLA
jgi:hypothetical protein